MVNKDRQAWGKSIPEMMAEMQKRYDTEFRRAAHTLMKAPVTTLDASRLNLSKVRTRHLKLVWNKDGS